MVILKCKMCGGDIQVNEQSYGTCDSCGSTMTLPRIDEEKKQISITEPIILDYKMILTKHYKHMRIY